LFSAASIASQFRGVAVSTFRVSCWAAVVPVIGGEVKLESEVENAAAADGDDDDNNDDDDNGDDFDGVIIICAVGR
jgi:hypothetical protein